MSTASVKEHPNGEEAIEGKEEGGREEEEREG